MCRGPLPQLFKLHEVKLDPVLCHSCSKDLSGTRRVHSECSGVLYLQIWVSKTFLPPIGNLFCCKLFFGYTMLSEKSTALEKESCEKNILNILCI